MSQAEELLNSLEDDQISLLTVDPETEPHIVIGSDRFITVPKELQRIAVQYDHNVETVTFDCPRYWDGLDMSTMRIYINYIRPDKGKGNYLANNITVEDDIMHFDWVISRNVTEKDGILTFLVCVKKSDEDDNEVNHWNSELNSQMYISKGLEVDNDTVLMDYPDYLASLERAYSESFDNLKAEILAAADAGEFNGEDGVSPTISLVDIEGGTRVTMTDHQGVNTFDVMDGADGVDGVSPTVVVTPITDGNRVTITDTNGSQTFDVPDGQNGSDGVNGEDGVSPTITVIELQGGHRVTITDVTGTKSFDVMDGTTEVSEAVTDYMNNYMYIGEVEPTSGPVLWFDTSATVS